MKADGAVAERRDSAQFASAREAWWFPKVRLLAYACYAMLVVTAMVSLDPEWLLPVVQIPLLYVITKWLVRRIAQSEQDISIYGLLMAAFEFKMTGTLLRTAVNNLLFNGMSDAREYNHYGKLIGASFRALDFNVKVGRVEGTGFMKLVTGIVYSFWGDSLLGASLFFSWLAFLGMVLLWLAFRGSVSRTQSRRYGHLLFFIPSMIYWPSTLGKDALAILFIGLASFGISRLISARVLTGAVALVAGTAGLIYLRPHIALTVFAGALLAIAFWKSKKNAGRSGILRIVLFCGFSLMLMVVIGRTETFFGVSKLDPQTVSQTLDSTTERTGEAGSSFTPIRMTNPVTVIPALGSVLYRPLPFETTNFVGLLAGAESLFLIVVTIRSRRRLANLFRAIREYVYPAYALGMTLAFAFAFSSFSNFGILARQRTQMLPLFLVLICIPTRSEMIEELASHEGEALGLDGPATLSREVPALPVAVASQTPAAPVLADPRPGSPSRDPNASLPRIGSFQWVASDAQFDFGIGGPTRPAPRPSRTRRKPDGPSGGERPPEPFRPSGADFGGDPEREFIERVPAGSGFKLVVSVRGDSAPLQVDELVGDVSLPSSARAGAIPFDLAVSGTGQVEFELSPDAVGLIEQGGQGALCRVFVIRDRQMLLLFGVRLFVDESPDRGVA
jgi:hypothetical protein